MASGSEPVGGVCWGLSGEGQGSTRLSAASHSEHPSAPPVVPALPLPAPKAGPGILGPTCQPAGVLSWQGAQGRGPTRRGPTPSPGQQDSRPASPWPPPLSSAFVSRKAGISGRASAPGYGAGLAGGCSGVVGGGEGPFLPLQDLGGQSLGLPGLWRAGLGLPTVISGPVPSTRGPFRPRGISSASGRRPRVA